MNIESLPLLNELNPVSITVRILLALVLGGLLGLEREKKQRPAGFRTYVVVCIGSALACITNIYICNYLGGSDPARIPAQVISGIGFLGAGTIIVTRNNHIKGLTTAAGLWCCATIGIAVGSGFYFGAIICDLLLVFSLRILTIVDKHYVRYNKYISMYVQCRQNEFIVNLVRYTKNNSYQLFDLEVYPATEHSSCYAMFSIKVDNPGKRNQVIEDIAKLEGCELVEEMSS